MMSKLAKVKPYPATTHSMALALAWNEVCMDGKATLTIKKSKTIMNVPAIKIGNGAQRLDAKARIGP